MSHIELIRNSVLRNPFETAPGGVGRAAASALVAAAYLGLFVTAIAREDLATPGAPDDAVKAIQSGVAAVASR